MRHLTPFEGFKRPLLFAHRGLSALAPENTLAAFRLAMSHGIPGLELDIHLGLSGELIVFHDDTLRRITGHEGHVERTDFKTLRGLDAGKWKGPEHAGEKIPTLREVFELCGKNAYYDIEIKSRNRGPSGMEKALSDLIDEFNLGRHVAVTSFNPFPLKAWKALRPDIPTGIIYSNSKEVPAILRHGQGRWLGGTDFLKPAHSKVNSISDFFNHRLGGREVIPWTIDDAGIAERCLAHGVSGIISNVPHEMKKLVGLP